MNIDIGPAFRANVRIRTPRLGVCLPPGGWFRVFGYGLLVELGDAASPRFQRRRLGPLSYRVLRPGNRRVAR